MNLVKGVLIFFVTVVIIINQVQISHATMMMGSKSFVTKFVASVFSTEDNKKIVGWRDLGDVNISTIKSTAQGVAAIFPLDQTKTSEEIISMMLPVGTPEYGQAMGVSFDTPEASLATLAKAQKPLLAGLSPEQKERFINLASQPVGISCEFCCGLKAVGIREDGSSSCGCQHNPALLSVTMWLMQNTDYTDAEILREVYQWKSLFFPKNMVELATKIAGGDEAVLQDLPSMVGGC